MIHVYCWNDATQTGSWRGPEALADPGESRVVWIDLDDPTPDEERRVLVEYFPVHLLTLEDMAYLRRNPGADPHLPKVEEFRDYLFVLVNPLHPATIDRVKQERPVSPDGAMVTQLSAILTRDLLITYHAVELAAVRETRDALARGGIRPERGPDYLFHLVLDKVVDFYGPVIDCLEDHIDELEAVVFTKPTTKLFRRILTYKQLIAALRRSLLIEREVVIRLSRAEFALIDEREAAYYRNVLDHLTRFTAVIELAREQVHDLLEMHLAAQSNRLNEVIKVLTIISTVTLPMTLVAGVYGMNFQLFPDLPETGFWFALALMLLAGGVPLLIFRWRKWI